MHKILQNHLLCAFVANLKIGAIYALYPESFCDKNLAIRKVFAFCDSDDMVYGTLYTPSRITTESLVWLAYIFDANKTDILSSVCNCLQPKKISLPILEQIGDHNDQLTMCTSFQPSWEDLEKTKVLSSQIFVSAWYGTEGKSSCHFLAKWYISLFLVNPIPSTALFDILDAKSVSCSRNTFPSCLLPLANVTLEM